MCATVRRDDPQRCSQQYPNRRGITLLEVVIVVALIAVLLALLLMAVQRSRETALRVSCTGNLKQLGLAVQNYLNTYNKFPGLDSGNWSRQLLPYIDQAAVENQLQGWRGGRIEDLIYIPVYICPTDPYADQKRGYWPSYRISNGAYRQKCRCCDGLHHGCDPGYTGGKVVQRIQLSPRDVTDGLSQTSHFSEKLVFVNGGGSATDHPELWIRLMRQTPIPYWEPDELDKFADECEHRPLPAGPVWEHVGDSLMDSGAPQYDHVLPPNRNSCFNGSSASLGWDFGAETATSLHGGGVNVLMADGAVKFASESIDRMVWRAVGSRNGSEAEANRF